MNIYKMAWRNVWRNQRRTSITIAAMSLSLFIMINYSGLLSGYIIKMEQSILEYEVGDIQMFSPGYRDNPSIYNRIDQPDKVLEELDKIGMNASARLLASGLAAARDSSAGITLRGIDVERDARVSRIHQIVYKGKWLKSADPTGVVIGYRLARTLNIKIDEEIVVLSQGANGSFANELYRIRGILKMVSDGVDRTGLFMNSQSFRKLMAMPEGAHQIVIRKPDKMPLSHALAGTQKAFPRLDIKSWRQLIPVLASMLDSVQILVYAMFIIVYIAVGIIVVNAMLMAVFERMREFGVLKALGMGPGSLLGLIIVESALQTGISICIGGLCSIPTLHYLSTAGVHLGEMGGLTVVGIAFDSIMRASISANVYIGPIITLVFIVIIAVLYPAIKASLIRPVQAMVHQ